VRATRSETTTAKATKLSFMAVAFLKHVVRANQTHAPMFQRRSPVTPRLAGSPGCVPGKSVGDLNDRNHICDRRNDTAEQTGHCYGSNEIA